ncbi:SRPBCC family protein [Streptomyces sp. NPDC002896]|uniref:SRPBCC family protein n=1 Tax=Streptomyces sp. NPDC002896 TaxID=3154438 RepID=UPI0033269092
MADQSDGQRAVGGLGTLAKELPTERLIHDTQDLLAAMSGRAVSKLTERVTGGTLAGKALLKPLLKAGVRKAADKAKEAVSGALPGRSDKSIFKASNIVEQIDVGVPISVAYNQWTDFEQFPSFMKKVQKVEETSDTELEWKARVFLSTREWHSEIIEQVPDKRIVWRSKAVKGYVDGAVTFHEVAPELTRILLVLEYHPKGLFEHTGNLWRAPGRRARLEMKHYRRHVMTRTLLHPEKVEGRRGEVHEGKVVRRAEEAREEQEPAKDHEEEAEEQEEEPEETRAEGAPEPEEEEEPERDYGEEPGDEYEEEPEGEAEEGEYEEEEGEGEAQPEDEYPEEEDEEDYVGEERR